jgi:hypothetical protein
MLPLFDQYSQYSPGEGVDIGPYDFGSIMHYHATAFSHNGLPTITTLRGEVIGQRTHLSAGDIQGVRAMYPSAAAAPDTGGLDTATVPELLHAIRSRLAAAASPAAPPPAAPAATAPGEPAGTGSSGGGRFQHMTPVPPPPGSRRQPFRGHLERAEGAAANDWRTLNICCAVHTDYAG